VFIVVVLYFVIDLARKLLDTPSYKRPDSLVWQLARNCSYDHDNWWYM